MVGLLLIAAAAATALLAAVSMRLPSLVSTLLAAYLAFVANLGLVTLALSPIREVTRGGLALAEGVLLGGALAAWWLRGRPGLPLDTARAAAREIFRSPITAVFLGVVVALLAYELVLALTVPANNWDSLTYHLPRAAAWAQHGGIHLVPNAATGRINEYQPLAEQQLLFYFVAAGSDALFALPQYLAELAILLAVYGAARRLGYEVRPAACSAFLLATFSLVALQAPTAQNDLFAASFPVTAACLILGGSPIELALAGVAAGMGLGAKLTTALVLPVLVWLALLRGLRAFGIAVAGAVAALVAIGMWGFVLNLVHTGRVLGYLGTHVESTSLPVRPGKISTGLDVLYETFDLAILSDRVIDLLAIAGVLAATGVALYGLRQVRARPALARGVRVAVPFLSPMLVIAAAGVVAWLARRWGSPVRGSLGNVGDLNRTTNGSVFGPVGAVVFLGVPILTMLDYARRRVDARHLALAASVPIFFVLLSFETFNYFMTRFLLVPAALSAPLFARLFRGRTETAAYLAVAALVVGLVVTKDTMRPLDGRFGRPWNLTQAQAAALTEERGVGEAVAAYQALVPPQACVGAVLGSDEPGYFLWGRNLEHRVVYLSVNGAVPAALREGLFYVVISRGPNRWAAREFAAAGWKIQPLDGYWLLASGPAATDGRCV